MKGLLPLCYWYPILLICGGECGKADRRAEDRGGEPGATPVGGADLSVRGLSCVWPLGHAAWPRYGYADQNRI